LASPAGRREVLVELRRRSATLGRQVRAELGTGAELVGAAAEITDGGLLVVRTPAGDVAVSAGDVVHLRPAAGR
jgi:BirA family biotin operon repressor/biotin-[acetyl-CoA-carboxylase] ligase